MKPEHERLKQIEVVREEDGKVHVLGKDKEGNEDLGCGYRHHIVHDASTKKIIDEESDSFRDVDLNLRPPLIVFVVGMPYYLTGSRPERTRKTREYNRDLYRFRKANWDDLIEAVKDIKVYQGTINGVSDDLGIELERVDTGKTETFVKAEEPDPVGVEEPSTFWLRVRAYELGADCIVHYQRGSSIGTPVRYVKKDSQSIV